MGDRDDDRDDIPFWRRKSLVEMSPTEWESLCDGCGQCCLHKLEDTDSGEIQDTNVACRLLDTATGRCRHYAERSQWVADCKALTPDNVGKLAWLPDTCAYRLLARGKDLPNWHPLLTHDPESVVRAGLSVRGRVISETTAGPLENHIVQWWPRQRG